MLHTMDPDKITLELIRQGVDPTHIGYRNETARVLLEAMDEAEQEIYHAAAKERLVEDCAAYARQMQGIPTMNPEDQQM